MTAPAARPSDEIIANLLAGMRLPVVQLCRLYAALEPFLPAAERAAEVGESWPLQIIDRRWALWPDSRPFDFVAGEFVQTIAQRPRESVAVDLTRYLEQGTDDT